MKSFVKDPDATLDYTFNWGPWLDGDTISTSVWTLETPLSSVSESKTDTTATIFISGGTHLQDYSATNRITTVSGRTDDRTFTLRIRNK